jgi:uncharacterized protein
MQSETSVPPAAHAFLRCAVSLTDTNGGCYGRKDLTLDVISLDPVREVINVRIEVAKPSKSRSWQTLKPADVREFVVHVDDRYLTFQMAVDGSGSSAILEIALNGSIGGYPLDHYTGRLSISASKEGNEASQPVRLTVWPLVSNWNVEMSRSNPASMMAVVPTHEVAMRAQAIALEIDDVDLEALETFLTSDRSPPDCMMLSELDGFLTGIAAGPELILPSQWLPPIWGGAEPEFAGLDEANAILRSLMARYNEILRGISDHALVPIFLGDRNGTDGAMDWARGFLQAIMLREEAWEPLFKSRRDGKLLLPILSLCCDKNGDSLLGLPPEAEDFIAAKMPKLIPGCVIGIATYWRRKGQPQASMSLKARPRSAATRVGRNHACPCGSGRKFKRCCGHAA